MFSPVIFVCYSNVSCTSYINSSLQVPNYAFHKSIICNIINAICNSCYFCDFQIEIQRLFSFILEHKFQLGVLQLRLPIKQYFLQQSAIQSLKSGSVSYLYKYTYIFCREYLSIYFFI